MSQSREKLIDAAIELLSSGSNDLSVMDVTKRAGVSRPTFYAYFPSAAALVREATIHRISEAIAVPDNADHFAYVREILGELRDGKEFYTGALRGPAGYSLLTSVIEFVAGYLQRRPELELTHSTERARFVAAGAVFFTARWLESDEASDLDEVTAHIIRLVKGSEPPRP